MDRRTEIAFAIATLATGVRAVVHGAICLSSSGSVGGYDCVLDPWGNAYHVGTLDDIKGFDVRNVKMAKLKTFMVGEWVLWSCGPNGVNDGGLWLCDAEQEHDALVPVLQAQGAG